MRIIAAAALPAGTQRFPKHNWPLAALEPGQAFVIPLQNNRDADGRSEKYVRQLVWQAAQRLGYTLCCRKVQGGLAVIRD